MKKNNIFKFSLVFSFVIIIIIASLYIYPSLRIATGYAAKYTCSYTFIAHLKFEKIRNSFNFFPVNKVSCEIDENEKSVTASLFGLAKRKAFFYQQEKICGCTLDSVVKKIPKNDIPANESKNNFRLFHSPVGDEIPDSVKQKINFEKLDEILSSVLDTNPATLAIVVAYRNYLIAEKYAGGISDTTPLLGWSMTKSVLNALFGILEKNGNVNLDESDIFPEWKNDERKKITVNNLLQMSSGLKWNEEYSMKTDVTQMLYLEPDIPAYASQKYIDNVPGSTWYYSSGTTNILSAILRKKFSSYEKYLSFPYDSLFNVIGMSSAIVETDNTGNYILSSYGWATARDWTKFGLLYLNKGNWFGKQIFEHGWVEYSVTPVASSGGVYGAQIWLNSPSDGKYHYSSLPGDAYFFNGYGGQKILVVPSMETVIVILSGRQKEFDFNKFYSEIFQSLYK